MVEIQIERRGIKDPRLLKVMRDSPRHLFIPPHLKNRLINLTKDWNRKPIFKIINN